MKRSPTTRTGNRGLFPAALFNRRAAALLATGALMLSAHSAVADTYWNSVSGNFDVAANWNTGVKPSVNDNADVSDGYTVTINGDEAVNDLRAATTGGISGAYMQTSGNVTCGNGGTGQFRLGVNSGYSGQYFMSGGTFTMVSNGQLNVGESNGSNFANASILDLSGAAIFSNQHAGASQMSIGGGVGTGVGTGTLNLAGSATINNSNELWVGNNAGSTGVMNMTGGTVNEGTGFVLGRIGGNGTLNFSGGTINQNGSTVLVSYNYTNSSLPTTGLMTMSSTAVYNGNTSAFYVGQGIGAAGTLTMTGGTFNQGNFLVFGQAGGHGTLNLSGTAVINNSGELWLGQDPGSTGTMNMSGGTVNESNFFVIGRGGGTGILNFSGGTINKTGGGTFTFTGNGGTLNQTGGTLNNTTSTTLIGENANGASSSYVMSGGVANLRDVLVGYSGTGTGTLSVSGGTMTTTALHIGLSENQIGTLTMSGTGVLNAADVHLGTYYSSQGTLNLNGGTFGATSILNNDGVGNGTGQTDTINFNGGTLKALGTSTDFIKQGGTKTFVTQVQAGGAVLDTNGNAVTISKALTHDATAGAPAADGGLTKNGTGTLKLTAASTYTGATTITAGILQIGSGGAAPTGSIANTSAVNIGSGTTLITAANGAFSSPLATVNLTGGTIQNANTAANGNSGTNTGPTNNTQTFGALILGSGISILDFGAANNGAIFQFADSSIQSWAGDGVLDVYNWQGLYPTSYDPATLKGFGPNGGLDQLYFGTSSAGLTTTQLQAIHFFSNSGTTSLGSGLSVINQSGQVSAAPEPAQTAALGLFGLGLGALVIKARKRKASGMAV